MNKTAFSMMFVIGIMLIGCNIARAIPPLIVELSWGKMVVRYNNKEYRYRDCKVWPTGSKEWNWKETGTKHDPGIQIDDLKALINDVDIVILTQGMDGVLKVPQATIDYVKSMGKECIVGRAEEMVACYNELAKQGKKVGGLFHSTC